MKHSAYARTAKVNSLADFRLVFEKVFEGVANDCMEGIDGTIIRIANPYPDVWPGNNQVRLNQSYWGHFKRASL